MKNIIFYVCFLLFSMESFAQKTLEGVTLPATLSKGKTTLVLNGAGVREKYFKGLYVGGLYLKEKSTDASKILNSNEPVGVRIQVISSLVSSKKMEESIREGFQKSTSGNTGQIKDKVENFIGLFREEIKVGDVFDIVYQPSDGVRIFKNNKDKGTIQGQDFRNALFGIWIGNKPADDDLKSSMLGYN